MSGQMNEAAGNLVKGWQKLVHCKSCKRGSSDTLDHEIVILLA